MTRTGKQVTPVVDRKGYAMNVHGRSATAAPRSLGALLAQQARVAGHEPFLTYYDDVSGERTELSYATFDNWVSKTANLLVEEVRAAPGSSLSVGVADHWIGAVFVAAAWKVGAVIRMGVDDGCDVVAVAEGDRRSVRIGHPGLVVVGEGMGGRVVDDGPGLDYGGEVLAFGDDYDDPDVTMDSPAVATPGGVITHGEVYAAAAGALPAGTRLLVARPLDDDQPRLALAVCAGASLVWCPRSAGADLTRRAADERVTHRLAGDGSIEPA